MRGQKSRATLLVQRHENFMGDDRGEFFNIIYFSSAFAKKWRFLTALLVYEGYLSMLRCEWL